jgi:probable O-glycosylation ligase (exosortase A-associated)
VSLRDLVVTTIIFGLLPVCLLRPWIGVLVWSWIGFMNPHRLTWGFAYTMPFAAMVAAPTLVGLLFTQERRRLPRTIEVAFLLALWGLFLVTTWSSWYPDDAWVQLDQISKILLMIFVTLLLFQDERKLKALLYVVALSVGFYGFKGGLWAILTGGTNRVLGPPESFIAGNTELGLALNMVLPILLLLSREQHVPWAKLFLRATLVLSIVAVLFTYSRGALLGLLVVLPLMLLRSRARFAVIPLAALAIWIGPSLMPQVWLERMSTIQTYEEDLSARMRLDSWRVAYQIALERPLLGAGFKPFRPEVYERYSVEGLNTWQDAHSIYFQVLAEQGFTGIVLYLGLIAVTMTTLRRVMRRAREQPSLAFLGDTARMVEVSLVGFLVSGAFLSISYFDLFFTLVGVAVVLKVLALAPAPVAEPAGARRAPLQVDAAARAWS